ncbi:hypothetical protein [Scytonema sp. UIC 10036]|uniref:hypothetical protein n=1 Tax=Scytonema sp. UIC 10036 TaxID=2304196 RepID=UPI001A9BC80E|nr:hypothetical protein [Scytonema sp. UIC 10036]
MAEQLTQYINHRLGRSQPPTTNDQLPITNSLDIFNFRNEVIGDYRRYIESFLRLIVNRILFIMRKRSQFSAMVLLMTIQISAH